MSRPSARVEDVPEGLQRFSVTVTLAADDGAALTCTRRDFTVSRPGVQPVVPVSGQIKGATLQAGTAVSGGLTFDVPKESSQLTLQFRGGQTVALPALPAAKTGQHGAEEGHQADAGHEGDGAAASGKGGTGRAPVTAPAPAAGSSDHAHAPGAPAHDH